MPLPPLLQIPALFFLLSAASAAIDTYNTSHPGCPIVECGGVNISYPFWVDPSPDSSADPNSHCGYRDLKITCRDGDTPIFRTLTDNYTVRSINHSAQTISLVDADVQGDCPRARHNVSITSLRGVVFNADVVAVLFFFNCNSRLTNGLNIPPGNVAGCLQREAGLSYVFDLEAPLPLEMNTGLVNACRVPPIESRVRRSELARGSLNESFGRAMNSGFDLKWTDHDGNMADCTDCERRGGQCGHNNGTSGLVFQCFCPDGRPNCYNSKGAMNWKLKAGIAVAGVSLGVILAAVAVFFWRQRKKRLEKRNSSVTASFFKSVTPSSSSFGFGGDLESSPGAGYYQTPMFTYEELEAATGGFAQELGDGGFGTVYKGKLKDGRVVAIKCLHQNTFRRVQQFRNEIEILNRLRHQNLVTLYGCSTRDSPKLLLVYEYVPNGTVADHLHGARAAERALAWPLRMAVAIESAAALAYLHAVKPQIIHRDVKTSNILLDADFHVKVADFGLSRLFPDLGVTHVSTAPQGTPGYVDPEYHQCYQLTDKSDVYSFGVVLVELVSSMPAVDITRSRNEINLANLAMARIAAGEVAQMADTGLGYGSDSEVTAMMDGVCELAFRCLQQERDNRPTMHEVLEELKRIQLAAGDPAGGKKGDHHKKRTTSGEGAYLLHIGSLAGSSPPFSPTTVNGTSWPSRSTTTNVSC